MSPINWLWANPANILWLLPVCVYLAFLGLAQGFLIYFYFDELWCNHKKRREERKGRCL